MPDRERRRDHLLSLNGSCILNHARRTLTIARQLKEDRI